MIYINDKNRNIDRIKNKDFGENLRMIDGNILATRWIDGDLTLVKNIEVIKGIFGYKYDHEAKTKYYMMLRDLEIIDANEYIILIDALSIVRS